MAAEPAAQSRRHLNQAFPGHGTDELIGETFELTGEQPDPVHVEVVGDDSGNGREQPTRRGHQRLSYTWRDRGKIARPLGRDPDECTHNAEDRAGEPQQWTD